MYHMNRIIKYWLIGTILLLAIYAVIFLFRKNFDHTFLLWVMILTPVTCLVFLFLTNLFDSVLEHRGFLNTGDNAIITKGDQDGVYGVTNAMKIVEVGQVV